MINGTCHCGQVTWRLDKTLERATACNCTLCRRYGALWGYGYRGHDFHVDGPTQVYQRADQSALDFHFCATCGCLTHYTARQADKQGRILAAANLRMAELDAVAELPIRHFDGLTKWDEVPREGSKLRDLWA